MRARFEEAYRTSAWGRGSGDGSDPTACRAYVAFLQRFLRERGVRTVADFGCGDWRFSRHIDWSGVRYRGYDIVPEVVESNRQRFAREGVRFDLIEGALGEVEVADLLIVKDVLQHWSLARVREFLAGIARFRWTLVTNSVAPAGPTANRDIADADYRPLDIRLPPLDVPATAVLEFRTGRRAWLPWRTGTRTRKCVLLVNGGAE